MSFRLAKHLAFLASDLDENKDQVPGDLRERTIACMQEMHELAYVLAGARVAEIYGDPEDTLPISPLEETCV